MTCKAFASTCNGEDVRTIRRFLRHTDEPACKGCRDALQAIGADFTEVERRGEDRPFQPLWLRNLRAKDLTAA